MSEKNNGKFILNKLIDSPLKTISKYTRQIRLKEKFDGIRLCVVNDEKE